MAPNILLPPDIVPDDGRFGAGPSKVRRAQIDALVDVSQSLLGTSHRQGAASVTQLEIMPLPPGARPDAQPWPTYPMLYRVTSAHEEGGVREYAVSTLRFTGDESVSGVEIVDVAARKSVGTFSLNSGNTTVQIAGMNPLEETDPNDKGSYANASLTGRIVTILAGSLANYLVASVFFLVAILISGSIALMVVTFVSRRLDRLVARSDAMAEGDLSQNVELGSIVEMARPASSFNTMAARLRRSFDIGRFHHGKCTFERRCPDTDG